MGIRIKLLGRFEVHRDGQPIPQTEWRTEKNKDLLKLLALYPDRPLPQDWLMEALWPAQDPERSVRNLRGRISELRRVLEPALSQGSASTHIQTVANGYTLDTQHCAIDAEVFARCYRQAVAQAEYASARAIQTFKRAIDVYVGDLLPADRHKDWTLERRAELRRLYLDALRQLTELLYGDRQYDESIRYGETALDADPHDERIYRTLMRAHHELGNAHAALQLYERCRRALEASDMLPSDATEHLAATMRSHAYRHAEQVTMEHQCRLINDRLAEASSPDARWDLMGQQIELLHGLGRRNEEADAIQASEQLARRLADPGKLGRVHIKWAEYHRAMGDVAASTRHAEQAYEQFAALDDPLGLAEALFALAQCAAARRDAAETRERCRQALAQLRAAEGLRADRIRVRIWTRLGRLSVERQRYDAALAYYDQAMRLSQSIEEYTQQARLFLNLGSLHYYRDHVAEAGVHWEQGRQLASRIGHRRLEAKCLNNLALLKKNRADLTAAWGLYETVIEIQERLDDVGGLAKSWNNLGILHDALGRPTDALAAFERARRYSADAGDDLGMAAEAMAIASVQIHQGAYDAAAQRLGDALEVFRAHEHAWYETQALYYMGELALAQRELAYAHRQLDDARDLAQRIGSRKLAEHARAALAAVELKRGRGKAALEWARTVESTLAETPPGIDDTRVLYRLYRVLGDAGRLERARHYLGQAQALVSRLARQLDDDAGRDYLESVPLYRAILAERAASGEA